MTIETVTISGTVVDATGRGVVGAVIRLAPAPRDLDTSETGQGVGVVLDAVEVLTDEDGDFEIEAIVGFRYSLTIPALGHAETFVCPDADAEFDVLGLVPTVGQATPFDDQDGATSVVVYILVSRLPTVMAKFDTLVLERADASDGPWVEAETWELFSAADVYSFIDADGDVDTWYRARYLSTLTLAESGASDPLPAAAATTDDLVISVDELTKHYLFGVTLSDSGKPYPKSMFEAYIRAATRQLEHELDCTLTATDYVDETHDFRGSDWGTWGYVQLHHWPVTRVDKLAFRYPSMTEEVEISAEWVILQDGGATGQVQVVPGRGSIADVLLIPGQLMPMWHGGRGVVPGVWRVSYRAGFEPGAVPDDIKHAVGMMAAIGPLNIAGDLVAGAGLASYSLSVPGVSQSISTTASATNAGYGARIIEYQKELKDLLPVLKAQYGKSLKMLTA